jgi:hypothetical protein
VEIQQRGDLVTGTTGTGCSTKPLRTSSMAPAELLPRSRARASHGYSPTGLPSRRSSRRAMVGIVSMLP